MDIFKPIIGLFVRHLLGILGGYLVANGFVTEADWTNFAVGAVAIFVALILSGVNKLLHFKTVDTALQLPAGSSFSQLKNVLKS